MNQQYANEEIKTALEDRLQGYEETDEGIREAIEATARALDITILQVEKVLGWQ